MRHANADMQKKLFLFLFAPAIMFAFLAIYISTIYISYVARACDRAYHCYSESRFDTGQKLEMEKLIKLVWSQ